MQLNEMDMKYCMNDRKQHTINKPFESWVVTSMLFLVRAELNHSVSGFL